jgi:S1-C subfamily serine protease
MKRFLMPDKPLGLLLLGIALMTPSGASVQAQAAIPLLDPHSVSQGYLGVELADVDQQKAQALRLKQVRGALITLIDHDAPAGKIGLKINDVIVQLNGQAVEGAEQLRRSLREIPAGRKITLEISRDGSLQKLTAQLADRRAMEQDVWNRIGAGGEGGETFQPSPGMGILSGGGNAPLSGGFHIPFFSGSLKVGALVEPLTAQMAEALGVPGGLMVRHVARRSEADAAGMKACDVILRAGSEPVATLAGWQRALHANQGKPVTVTVLRDRKPQTLTLQVDSKRR